MTFVGKSGLALTGIRLASAQKERRHRGDKEDTAVSIVATATLSLELALAVNGVIRAIMLKKRRSSESQGVLPNFHWNDSDEDRRRNSARSQF